MGKGLELRSKSKEELLQLLDAYRQVIDFNIICSITDPEGKITYVNETFCKVSKFSADELLGQNHRIVNSGYHPREFFADLWSTISSGRVWRGEVKSKAKDGTFFWLDSTIVPVRDKNGRIREYFSLRLPIDDRKQVEKELQDHVNSLEKMIFMISHQVRQPVSQILEIASVLEDGGISADESRELFSYMKESAERLDQLTRELTRFMDDLRPGNKSRG